MFHGHQLLRKINTKFFKPDGSFISWTENNFSFKHQRTYFLDKPKEIPTGFEATTTCTYNSVGKTEITEGGAGINDEMCIVAVFFYPRENGITNCMFRNEEDLCDSYSKIERIISYEEDLSAASDIFIGKLFLVILYLFL